MALHPDIDFSDLLAANRHPTMIGRIALRLAFALRRVSYSIENCFPTPLAMMTNGWELLPNLIKRHPQNFILQKIRDRVFGRHLHDKEMVPVLRQPDFLRGAIKSAEASHHE